MKPTRLILAAAFATGLCFAAEDAAALYKRQCAACHGADGAGQTGAGKMLKVRDLGSPEVQNQSDGQLFTVIAKGKGKMPSFVKNLGEDNINALVKHIRAFAKGGEKKK